MYADTERTPEDMGCVYRANFVLYRLNPVGFCAASNNESTNAIHCYAKYDRLDWDVLESRI